MNIPQGVLAASWAWGGWLLALALLTQALVRAPWHKVRGDIKAQQVFAVTTLLVFALWSVKAEIGPGLGFHFLGATVVTLMFGWQFALILMALVVSLITLVGEAGWDAWGVNFLTQGAVAVAVTWWALVLSYRYMPRHFFFYTFVNAFLVGALAMIAAVLALSMALVQGGVIEWERLSYQFLPLTPMMAGPEAFLSGFVMTILVLFRVEWVSTFTDEQYLKGK